MKKYILISIIFTVLWGSTKNDSTKTSTQDIENITIVKSYKNSQFFRSEAYCYFVFQKIITPKDINPNLFSKYIKGATLSLHFLHLYNEWLKSEDGIKCKNLIGKSFKPIESSLNKKFIIFLNLKAIEEDGNSLEITYNHERLHVAFSLYKSNRVRIKKRLDSLPKKQREAFFNSHPGYNFKNTDVQLREYYAYEFQNNYQEGLDFLAK